MPVFQPGGEKALEIVESKRKELASLMKASLPSCDRMGLVCRFFAYSLSKSLTWTQDSGLQVFFGRCGRWIMDFCDKIS